MNTIKGGITLAAATLAILLGLWGYGIAFPVDPDKPIWAQALDNIYRTIRLLVMEGDPGDSAEPVWQLTLARIAAAIAFFSALLWVGYRLLRDHIRRARAARTYKDHLVICGLGERGYALARDVLRRGQRVVVIDCDPQPGHLEEIADLGAAFVHGDATRPDTLQRAGVSRAAHVVTLTDNDSANIAILSALLAIERDAKEALHCHLHLARGESRGLFEEGGPFHVTALRDKRVLVSVFNLYELAAVDLFEQSPLGAGVDTVSEGAEPLSVLIAGFGRVGQAVLLEAMAQGHFCNGAPIRLVVVDEDASQRERRFHQTYREVAGHHDGRGLNLWSVAFREELPEDVELCRFHHIIAAHDDSNEALACALGLLERRRIAFASVDEVKRPLIAFHAANGQRFQHPLLADFGDLAKLCTSAMIIEGTWERACRVSHDDYSRGKLGIAETQVAAKVLRRLQADHDDGEKDPNRWLLWEHLPLYKRRSNLAEKRHLVVKLRALGLVHSDLTGTAGDDALAEGLPQIEHWPDLRGPASRLVQAANARGLEKAEMVCRFERVARAEHNRWNAFHVLDNWRYGERKSEWLRTHDCLLDWPTVAERKADVLRYDYKNVYQIPKLLDLLPEKA